MTSFRIFNNNLHTQSEDFINLSEPPKPKDSPMLGFENGVYYNTDNGNTNNITSSNNNNTGLFCGRNRLLFPRRRSTNYMDALTLQEKQKNKHKLFSKNRNNSDNNFHNCRGEPTSKRSQRRKSLLSGMDFQDTRHDIQNSNVSSDNNSINEYTLQHHDMGDYFQRPKSPEYSPKPNHSLFKKQYRTDGITAGTEDNSFTQEDSESENESIPSRRSLSRGRKLSFEYEDFKKDIYNKLNFFDKN
ncbi:similar to Saccharomyces cerevisiae YFR017C IGD1 Cytoplasmic protein that inhibits Gdb1p glycogen debranching activity [Maudiozyma barnettii]|uniref:Similar to Saccharomyces cerevisiae YFR017C IGD1 Cytoplasmic protein that inhibits Gdb1p glycogen debranching activity n=1 Tax=Maudiozyma barnettii TaxID=61262 RepID=A0A8H2ZGE9_9SACH|nr:Igd1p [Kazachstania barnettii]CAB4254529.1 similar to Saccharomyces cerevisiae YFR017C IGD1 Cytoplasmic protein that inhibits Gdb1p glycogen debranching activity [Kazachstania barnettii]CAD1782569.1 similar to Saccharomyces cerevisiae YFR017C IGD1 Cytoplasmic protein that inhibits Gdb1p glycogen debranching activity [Kazachstania barnettii]